MARHLFRVLGAACAVAALASCGGGGGGSGGGIAAPDTPLAKAQSQLAVARQIVDRYGLDDETRAEQRSALPMTGSATYRGTIVLSFMDSAFDETRNAIGDTEITANFGANTVSGTARNFNGYPAAGDSDRITSAVAGSGRLAITAGRIEENPAGEAQLSARVAGRLSDGVDTADIDASLVGGFAGGGNAMLGLIDGRYDTGDGILLPLDGVIVAER